MTLHRCFIRLSTWATLILAVIPALTLIAAPAPAPIRVLLVTGGCCHDYARQKDILKQGLEKHANITVEQAHSADSSTRPPLPILHHPDYAKGFDVIVHDECGADISDEATVRDVLQPHLDGVPGVNLHCAMHSYRFGDPNQPAKAGTPHGLWFEYLGLQSSGHGPQEPIAIHFVDPQPPLTKGLTDWTTIPEEHYNNVQVFDTSQALARGTQIIKSRSGNQRTNDFVVAWVNQYGPKKTRVFSTTIGHNNETVSDPRYLDLVTRGVLWAAGHLKEDGTPAEGYGPRGN